MKTTNINNVATKTTTKQKFIAVLLAVALVAMQSPIGYAGSSSDKVSGDVAAEFQNTVDINLDLSHAYLNYNDQTIALPATKVTVPTWTDFKFSVAADTGYENPKVVVNVNGADETLTPNADGVYTISDEDVAGIVKLTVSASEQPAAQTAESSAAEGLTVPEATSATNADETSAAEATEEATEAAEATESDETATKVDYSYEDANVKVAATLTDAAAVPDDANFVVTPVTKDSTGYNYDAYMQALNDNAADGDEYTSENTLLYDVAFMVQKTDAAGNAIEGETEEFQPTDGSVKINFEFKSAQLSDDLGAEEATDVEVGHLPLVDSVKESVESTQAATDISASDVKVESVSAAVNVAAETSSFSVDSFSVFYFKDNRGQQNTWSGTTAYSIGDIFNGLGETTGFAVYANKFINTIHLEGNVKVGELDTKGVADASLNQDSNVVTRNAIEKVTVTKSLEKAESEDKTFDFGVYAIDDVVAGNEIHTFSITVPKGKTSAAETLTKDNAAAVIAKLTSKDVIIYELDNGKILNEGSKSASGYKVSYTANQVKSSADSDLYTNYIGTITDSTSTNGKTLVNQNYFDQGLQGYHTYIEKLNNARFEGTHYVFDSGVEVSVKDYKGVDADAVRITQKDGITAEVSSTLNSLKTFSSDLAKAQNGAKAGSGSLSVVNLVSTTGWLSSDFDAANFKSIVNGEGIKETINEGGYLLVNIDVTGRDTYTLDQFQIDGYNADNNNEELARHIIYNFVTHDGTQASDGTWSEYKPYTGNITFSNVAAGTILAPSAKVVHAGGYRGMVIADVYDHTSGSELHKDVITRATEAQVYVSNSKENTAKGSLNLSGTKTLEGKTLTDKAYNFVVTEMVGGVEKTVATGTNDATGKINFTTINYGLADVGEHTYTVKEVKGSDAGVTYDENTYTVKVLVSDNGTGTLVVTVVEGSTSIDGLNFTNKYDASTDLTFTGTKLMDGRAFKTGDEYTFTISAAEGTPMPEKTSVTIKPESGTSAAIEFGEIEYKLSDLKDKTSDGKATGTFTYTITEQAVKDGTGVTADATPVIATVVVTDKGDGTLEKTVTYKKGEESATAITFTNTYRSEGTSANVVATKTFAQGSEWPEGATFEFVLAPGSAVAADGTTAIENPLKTSVTKTATKEAKTVDFGSIEYKQAGTYNYSITENHPADAELINGVWMKDGIAYDGATHAVVVTVVDNGNGTMSATVKYDDKEATTEGAVFTNSYNTTGTSVALEATKTLQGKKLEAGAFTFQLKDASGKAIGEPVANDATGKVTFPAISYSKADYDKAKTYEYTIEEVIPEGATDNGDGTYSLNGYTYDGAKYKATVTLTMDNAGKISAAVKYSKISGESAEEITGVPTFANRYLSGDTTLTATKYMDGRAFKAGDTYTFKVEAKDGAPAFEKSEVTITPASGTTASIDFGKATFTKAGTYTYVISENAVDAKGVKSDVNPVTVTITAKDNNDGTLSFTKTYTKDNSTVDAASFTNKYTSGETSASVGAKKAFAQGSEWPEGATFDFTLTPGDAKDASGKAISNPLESAVTKTATKDAPAVTFDSIAYKQAGTYTYTIKEVIPEGAEEINGVWMKDGIAYDGSTHNVLVTVTDDLEGHLSAKVVYDADATTGQGSTEVPTFTNSDQTTGTEIALAAQKTLNGKVPAKGQFSFKLTGEGQNQTVSNDETGKVTFGTISYSKADYDKQKTYVYTIEEVIPTGATPNEDGTYTYEGYTYDGAKYQATVTLTMGNDGQITPAVKYSKISGETTQEISGVPAFANSYVAAGETTLTATKLMDGRDFQEGDTYTFTVEAKDGAPAFSNPTVTINPTEGTSATVDFGSAKFTAAGTYTYVVSETAVDTNGVKSDPAPVTVKVVATDNGKGALDITKTYSKNDAEATGVVFTNTYKSDGATAQMTATKTLSGRDWNETDQFTFNLADEAGKVIDTQTATATNKTVTFAEQSYDKAGTYNYTITEVIPEGAEEINGVWMKDGVAYDASAHKVQVTVADNLAGKLVATVVYDESTATTAQFTNTYQDVTETSVAFEATKHLSGKELTEGEYSFQLKDANGNVLQTATNVKDGKVSFAPITYKEAGEYNYTIVEVNDGAEGVTYDTAERAVKVTVTKGNDNKLVVSVSYDGGTEAPEFTNTYFAAKAQFGFTKYFYGIDMSQKFSFTLTTADENGNAREGEVENPFSGTDTGQAFTISATAAGFGEDYSAAVDFGAIKYTAAGAYYYTVSEDVAEVDSIDMDTTTYLVRVTVADDQTTKAEYKVMNSDDAWTSFDDAEQPAFYNNQMVALSFASFAMSGDTKDEQNAIVYAAPQAKKVFKDQASGTDVAMTANEFYFDLVGENGEVLQTVGNAEDGSIAFEADHFDKEGVYTYKIRESESTSSNITFDKSEFNVTITVTKDESGALKADVAYTDAKGAAIDMPVFNNTIKTTNLKIQKVSRLTGEGLEDCTYALWMVTPTGDVQIAAATSDATGWIYFNNIDLVPGEKYYYKEVKAPSGHTVDPYRTAYFSLSEDGTQLVFVEDTADDGWHPKGTKSEYYNI